MDMKEHLSLVSPSAAHEHSYRSYVDEINRGNEKPVPFVLRFPFESFSDLLTELENCSKGVGLPEGFVPHSTFWLINREGDILGVSNIRHTLSPKLLREGGHIGYGVRPSERGNGYGTIILQKSLEEARRLRLDKVLITCGKTNVASARVIIQNGGLFQEEEFLPEEDEVIQRYWIEL